MCALQSDDEQLSWQSVRMAALRIVSIGYEGRTSEDLVRELVDQRVTVLVDVRLTPLSRKPGLSKTALSQRLADAGIAYMHLRALGNPKENRDPFRSGRVLEGRRAFADLLDQPDSQVALEEIARLAGGNVVGVLCFERDHEQCHRQVVTEHVMDRLPARARLQHA